MLRPAGWGIGALLLVVGPQVSGPNGGQPRGDGGPVHLIYLHGRIVQEQQSARPLHPEFGYYELEKILDALRSGGFIVSERY